jgi:hypothetical protein
MKRRFECTSERCSPALFLIARAAGGPGTAAIRVIRGAVGEIETIWAEQLGPNASLNYAALSSAIAPTFTTST